MRHSDERFGDVLGVGELSIGRRLGTGGQGVVYELVGRLQGFVYKQYRRFRSFVELADLVRFPSGLPGRTQTWLCERTAWPVAVVANDGHACGVVMPAASSRFYGPTAAGPRLRELQYLLYPPKPFWADMQLLGPAGRIAVARQMAMLVSCLHAHGLLVGDMSMMNVLWSPAPTRILLLDCDGIRPSSLAATRTLIHTIDWDDPIPSTGLDSDNYKLALLVGRVLAQSATVRPGQDLRLLPGLPFEMAVDVSVTFAEAAGPAGTRPDAARWLQALPIEPR